MRRFSGLLFALLLVGVLTGQAALAQYPPSPAPGPADPQPTPTERPGNDPDPDPPAETPTPAVPTPAPGPGPDGPGTQIVGGGGGNGGGGGGTNDDGIAPGQTLTLRGSGWLPNSSVDVVLFSTPRRLATVMTDATGSFEITVTVPADVEVGAHTLTVSGVDAAGNPREDSIPVQIAAAGEVLPVPDPAAAPAPGGLANTGLQLTNGLALMAALVAAAGGLLFAARRRRRGTPVSET